MKKTISTIFCSILVLFSLTSFSVADTLTWNSGAGDWTSANWLNSSGNMVGGTLISTDDSVINNGTVTVSAGGATSFAINKSLVVNSAATLKNSSDAYLFVGNFLDITPGNALLTVDGGTINWTKKLGIGRGTGEAVVTFKNGATGSFNQIGITANKAGSIGTLNVESGSTINVSDTLWVTQNGVGTINIDNATVISNNISGNNTSSDSGGVRGVINISNGGVLQATTTIDLAPRVASSPQADGLTTEITINRGSTMKTTKTDGGGIYLATKGNSKTTVNGGTIDSAYVLRVSEGTGNGTLIVNDGTVSAKQSLVVSTGTGTGTLTINGGTVSTNTNVFGGFNSGSAGSIVLNSGSIAALKEFAVSYGTDSTGTMTINGGTARGGTDGFNVAHNGTGTLILNGGAIQSSNSEIIIANGGTGTLILNGGSINTSLAFKVAASGTGTFAFTGGTVATKSFNAGGDANIYLVGGHTSWDLKEYVSLSETTTTNVLVTDTGFSPFVTGTNQNSTNSPIAFRGTLNLGLGSGFASLVSNSLTLANATKDIISATPTTVNPGIWNKPSLSADKKVYSTTLNETNKLGTLSISGQDALELTNATQLGYFEITGTPSTDKLMFSFEFDNGASAADLDTLVTWMNDKDAAFRSYCNLDASVLPDESGISFLADSFDAGQFLAFDLSPFNAHYNLDLGVSSAQAQGVPEPGSSVLMLIGLTGILYWRKRR